MNILIFALIVVIVAALLIYAVDMLPVSGQLNGVIKALVLVIAALVIISKAGLV